VVKGFLFPIEIGFRKWTEKDPDPVYIWAWMRRKKRKKEWCDET
jgi:hypothetical protein